MIWILAAASQLLGPQPIERNSWFSSRDVYYRVAARGESQENLVRVTIRPDGKVLRCEIEGPSRDVQLDRHACNIMRQRGRYEPARWIDGSTAYGVYRVNIRWQIGLRDTVEHYDSDADLVFRRPPKGLTHAGVVIAVDERGTITSCAAGVPSPEEPIAIPAQLEDLACRQIIAKYRPRPALDDRGRVVRSVQIARLRLRKW